MSTDIHIQLDDLTGSEIALFLEAHLQDMRSVSPPESKHALDLEGLRKPEVSFWTVYDTGKLVGCGALKQLSPRHGEIKSMRVDSHCRGKGIASKLLQHIITIARERGYQRLSLETGAMDFFRPAHALYRKNGFVETHAFADYKEDPNSKFMTLVL